MVSHILILKLKRSIARIIAHAQPCYSPWPSASDCLLTNDHLSGLVLIYAATIHKQVGGWLARCNNRQRNICGGVCHRWASKYFKSHMGSLCRAHGRDVAPNDCTGEGLRYRNYNCSKETEQLDLLSSAEPKAWTIEMVI